MYRLAVQVVPNASKTEIVGWHEGALKIRLAAPPVDGKANEELCRFLAKTFDLSPSMIDIERGGTGKKKIIRLPMSEADVLDVLKTCLSS
jgi:uncharacterized protein (TIGR00251 family)